MEIIYSIFYLSIFCVLIVSKYIISVYIIELFPYITIIYMLVFYYKNVVYVYLYNYCVSKELCFNIKVIQSNSKTKYVPRGFLVGKRLAQCLHPALPPGVHCKALECYDTIFRTIECKRLAQELPIYGPGLFSLLELSAMTVKPPLFDIYERHLLHLDKLLYPAFLGLLQVSFITLFCIE